VSGLVSWNCMMLRLFSFIFFGVGCLMSVLILIIDMILLMWVGMVCVVCLMRRCV